MSEPWKKSAAARCKEAKTAAGIYAVRCAPTGALWAGRATSLATVWNRITFELRQGCHRDRALQAAWNAHGPAALLFEPLERLDDDTLPYQRDGMLKDRLEAWCRRLGAAPLL
ncbi:MAG: GIY-YIG nuclease family protein [Hyphomicrobiaceae bacterium]|nr:GIY-YIG nuclease family protein [Hyphomicrobiaceae bacterium]